MCSQGDEKCYGKTVMMDGMERSLLLFIIITVKSFKSLFRASFSEPEVFFNFNKEVQKENVLKLNLFTRKKRHRKLMCVTSTQTTNKQWKEEETRSEVNRFVRVSFNFNSCLINKSKPLIDLNEALLEAKE
jgi:hypothetical protein